MSKLAAIAMLSRRSLFQQGLAMLSVLAFSLSSDDAVGGAAKPSVGWQEIAARSESVSPAELAAAKQKIDALPTDVRGRAESLLSRFASVSHDAVGIQHAVSVLDTELPGFFKYAQGERPGQDHPHGTAVRNAARMVLHGLLVISGNRAKSHNNPPSATAGILRALRSCKSFRSLEQTKLEEDLMMAVTSKVYFAAEQLVSDPASSPK